MEMAVNLAICKCQPYKKPDYNPLHINDFSNQYPNKIETFLSNISARVNNCLADETTFMSSKIYTTMHWPKVDLNIR